MKYEEIAAIAKKKLALRFDDDGKAQFTEKQLFSLLKQFYDAGYLTGCEDTELSILRMRNASRECDEAMDELSKVLDNWKPNTDQIFEYADNVSHYAEKVVRQKTGKDSGRVAWTDKKGRSVNVEVENSGPRLWERIKKKFRRNDDG